eukprot:scaffold7381_cov310-Pinguiococcus_pyrenoidosus.AAC.27
MARLLQLLQQGRPDVQEKSITAIAALAIASEEGELCSGKVGEDRKDESRGDIRRRTSYRPHLSWIIEPIREHA